MGVSQLDRIMTQALTAGVDPMLPVALVENGSALQRHAATAAVA